MIIIRERREEKETFGDPASVSVAAKIDEPEEV